MTEKTNNKKQTRQVGVSTDNIIAKTLNMPSRTITEWSKWNKEKNENSYRGKIYNCLKCLSKEDISFYSAKIQEINKSLNEEKNILNYSTIPKVTFLRWKKLEESDYRKKITNLLFKINLNKFKKLSQIEMKDLFTYKEWINFLNVKRITLDKWKVENKDIYKEMQLLSKYDVDKRLKAYYEIEKEDVGIINNLEIPDNIKLWKNSNIYKGKLFKIIVGGILVINKGVKNGKKYHK